MQQKLTLKHWDFVRSTAPTMQLSPNDRTPNGNGGTWVCLYVFFSLWLFVCLRRIAADSIQTDHKNRSHEYALYDREKERKKEKTTENKGERTHEIQAKSVLGVRLNQHWILKGKCVIYLVSWDTFWERKMMVREWQERERQNPSSLFVICCIRHATNDVISMKSVLNATGERKEGSSIKRIPKIRKE